MCRLLLTILTSILVHGPLPADDKPAPKPGDAPGRAEELKAIRAEYDKARDEFVAAIRAGKVKPEKDGGYAELAALQQRFFKRTRALIDADPKDAVALDAILFSLNSLAADVDDPSLYQLLLKHHLSSPKLQTVVGRPAAGDDFLKAVAERSPHARVRAMATYHRAENLANAGRAAEAEPLLEAIKRNAEWAKLPGYVAGNLGDTAGRLLFEIRHLSVGREVPEIDGKDLDDRPLKLSEYRGRATLVVFWATWCVPCMAMVPHERELVRRYAGRPFAVVGVNGDILGGAVTLPDGRKIDDTAKVKAAVAREQITWRSFRNGQFDVGLRWNVRSWPTVYLLDHRGIIRAKWRGSPDDTELDTAVARLVAEAEAARKEPANK
jgi:thiol-disulfide isomerase/thioredoxin